MAAEAHTIAELARALQARETTAEAVLERCLRRVAERNATLNAFITVFEDEAREQARGADREIRAGRYRGPLHGVPISIKDLFDVRGSATTAASRVRRNHVADRDAASITLLRDAGAVFVGKTNLHEFAFGPTNEESAYGPARHPLDPTRSPGGSSGGSAASVADGMCFASMGTDTGGSIRIPAAACGIVGLKPALGDISTDGVVPLSTTMDHVGPLCRSVEDAGIVYDVLRGSPRDESAFATLRRDESAFATLRRDKPGRPDARGLTLGVPRDFYLTLLDPQVASAFDNACQRLGGAGVQIDDVTIPHAGDVAAIYMHIALSEAAAYHAKTLERQPDDYTPGVRLRIEMGRYVLAEDYARAMRGRELLRHEVNAALAGRDGLLLPSLAIPAPKIGSATVRVAGVEEPIRNIMLRLTQTFNVSGHPVITMPCEKTTEGLPIGAQLVGTYGDTPGLLRVARAIECYLGPGMSR